MAEITSIFDFTKNQRIFEPFSKLILNCTALSTVIMLYFYCSTNGKYKEWEDVVTREEADPDVPILVIGTKQDLESQRGALPVHQKRSHIAEDYVTEEIHLCGTDAKSLMPGSSASNKLSRFFDKVIEKHFFQKRDKSGSGTFNHSDRIERRRLV